MSALLKQIKNAHVVPSALQLILIPLSVYIAQNDLIPNYLHYTGNKLMLLIPVMAAGALYIGGSYFRKRAKLSSTISDFSRKLKSYRNAVLIRSFSLFAVSICGQLAFIGSNYPYYLLMCLFSLLMYGILMPTHKTVAKDLLLSEQEQNQLIGK